MKSAAVIAAVLLGLGAPSNPVHAQSAPPRALAPTVRRAVEIPITLAGTQILIDGVRVNGRGPYRFLLDTGAQGAGRADVGLVQALNLPQVGTAGASDGGGGARRELAVHRIETLEFAGLTFRDLDVVSRDYNAGGAGGRGPIAGVLGIDLFRGGLVTLDYGRGVLRIEPGALPEADGRAVLAMDPDEPVPTVEIGLGGRTVKAHIDTGSMGGVTVGQATADALTFVAPPVAAGQARTVSGAFDVLQGRLAGDMTLGGQTFVQPMVGVMPHFRVGNLGGGLLRDQVTTLDLANHRVRFVASATPAVAPPRRYGLMMTPPSGGETELPLRGVAPESPAQAGGLRAGDVIVSLNGVAVADLGERLPGFMRATPLVVGYIRDGARHDVTLKLD